MKVRYIVLALALTGCGGKKGTIELDLVLPSSGTNPLTTGSKIEIIAGPKNASATLSGGNYSISFDQSPPKSAYNLVVQVLDAQGNITAYGETPQITLNAVNQGPFGVWLGIPGTIAASKSYLDQDSSLGATYMTGCNVKGLGAVVAGGFATTASGVAPTTTSYVYDVFTSAIIDTAALTTARAGGVCVPSSGKGIVFGGTTSAAAPFAGVGTTEAFDPTSGGSGTWVTIAPGTTMPTPVSFPSVAVVGSTGVVTGGYDSTGVATNAVTLLTTGDTTAVNGAATTSFMNAARVHHVSAQIPVGSVTADAIVIGGLSDAAVATNAAVVEMYVNGTFSTSTSIPGLPNLWYATATNTPGNTAVVVAGGTDGENGAPTDQVWLINGASGSVVGTQVATMSTPRARHTATLVGNDILVCGGVNAAGQALSSCDIISTTPTVTVTGQIGGLDARQNHLAIPLETGPVVFIGGDDGTAGTTGKAIHQIDVYTPTMVQEAAVNQANNAIIGNATVDGGT